MSGYHCRTQSGFIPLLIAACILGSLIKINVRHPPSCVTVTGIKAAQMLPSGRQNFTYYEKEVCDE